MSGAAATKGSKALNALGEFGLGMMSPRSGDKQLAALKAPLGQGPGERSDCFGFVTTPHCPADREKVRAGIDERTAILRGDPADRDTGDFHQVLPPGEQI